MYYDRLTEIGCIVCARKGEGYSIPEIHHLRTGAGMGQKSHWSKAIPLCHWHHRTGGYGVAIHAGQKTFEKNHGSELDLLAATIEALQ